MVIGICGGTGSGKTSVANRLLKSVKAGDVVYLQQDSYYRNLNDLPLDFRRAVNFDHPDAVDNDLLVEHLKALKNGQQVELPVYDFKHHMRLPETLRVEPTPIIIIEGILIFADARLLQEMDIKVLSIRRMTCVSYAACAATSPSAVAQPIPSSSNIFPLCARCTCSSSSRRSVTRT
jgi:uridine kinase